MHGLKYKSGEVENSFRPLNAATLWIGVLENSDKDKRLFRKQNEAYNVLKWWVGYATNVDLSVEKNAKAHK